MKISTQPNAENLTETDINTPKSLKILNFVKKDLIQFIQKLPKNIPIKEIIHASIYHLRQIKALSSEEIKLLENSKVLKFFIKNQKNILKSGVIAATMGLTSCGITDNRYSDSNKSIEYNNFIDADSYKYTVEQEEKLSTFIENNKLDLYKEIYTPLIINGEEIYLDIVTKDFARAISPETIFPIRIYNSAIKELQTFLNENPNIVPNIDSFHFEESSLVFLDENEQKYTISTDPSIKLSYDDGKYYCNDLSTCNDPKREDKLLNRLGEEPVLIKYNRSTFYNRDNPYLVPQDSESPKPEEMDSNFINSLNDESLRELDKLLCSTQYRNVKKEIKNLIRLKIEKTLHVDKIKEFYFKKHGISIELNDLYSKEELLSMEEIRKTLILIEPEFDFFGPDIIKKSHFKKLRIVDLSLTGQKGYTDATRVIKLGQYSNKSGSFIHEFLHDLDIARKKDKSLALNPDNEYWESQISTTYLGKNWKSATDITGVARKYGLQDANEDQATMLEAFYNNFSYLINRTENGDEDLQKKILMTYAFLQRISPKFTLEYILKKYKENMLRRLGVVSHDPNGLSNL